MFKLSSEASFDGSVTVENKFIVEYLPYADGDYVKVYLYGLSLAARKDDPDDSLDRLAKRLGIDRATVDAAIEYWTDQGLMARLGDDVSYLSPRTARPKVKKFDVDKYRDFNRIAQSYITSRMIDNRELGEYYALMEKFDLEPAAMTSIINYCVKLKGDNVSCPYIIAVARNLAQDGYRSAEEVENRLEEYGVYYNDLCAVLGAMGGKRPDHESVQLYKKWRSALKFDKDVILHVAKCVKRGGAATLDVKLAQYAELGLYTADKIDGYETQRKEMYKLAKSVNKALGVYYENVDPEISAYIRPWLDMGFESAAIVSVARYCMKNNLKTLADLDAVMRDFFAASATTDALAKERIDRETKYDGKIAELMSAFSMQGAVKPSLRAFYSNWTDNLKSSPQLIEYAAQLALTKSSPFAYMNSVLCAWHDKGITTAEGAKNDGEREAAATTDAHERTSSANTVNERFTAEELNSLFTAYGEDDD